MCDGVGGAGGGGGIGGDSGGVSGCGGDSGGAAGATGGDCGGNSGVGGDGGNQGCSSTGGNQGGIGCGGDSGNNVGSSPSDTTGGSGGVGESAVAAAVPRYLTSVSSASVAVATTSVGISSSSQYQPPSERLAERCGINRAKVARVSVSSKGMMCLDANSLKKLSRVCPALCDRAMAMVSELKMCGINIRVTQGLQSRCDCDDFPEIVGGDEQSNNSAESLAEKFHLYGLAIDIALLSEDGEESLEGNDSIWNQIGAAGERQGLEWGGNWGEYADRSHFQLTGGAKNADEWAETFQRAGLQGIWNAIAGAVTPSEAEENAQETTDGKSSEQMMETLTTSFNGILDTLKGLIGNVANRR